MQSMRRGVIATGWTGHDMTVVNSADLDREGGDLSPDDGQTLYAYSAVTDGASDLDPDVVTMAAVAPGGWPVETVDPDTGETIPAEVRLDVWPERLDVTAMVDLGDGETVPCVVPHSLRPLLVDGVREDGAGETVTATRVSGVWTVADVPGKRAVIEGTTIATPSLTSVPRTQITGSTLEVVRSDGEDGEVVTTRLGGEDEDQLLIYGADGELAAGMSSDGIITGDSLDVRSDVSVAGASLLQMIADRPQGIIAAHRFPARTPDVGTTETATVDLAFTAKPGRLYRFRVDGNFRASDSVRPTLRFRVSQGGDDGSAAAQPTVSSPQIGLSTVVGPTAGLIEARGSMEYTLITPATDPVRQIRVLLTIQGNSTSNAVFVYDSTEFTVSDDGALYSGTFNDGNSGASIVQTWTKTYPLSWVYLWRNGSGQRGVTTPQQGYATRALGVGHPGGQWYTMVGWPTQMQTDLTGAQSIANIQFYLNCYDTMNSGFIPRISFHANTSNPSTPTGVAPYDSNWVTKGAQGWMNIRADRIANIANGTWKGLTFGLNVGQDLNYAGCFSMLDPSGMSFRVTYTK
ncbi:hypothetical protein [Acidipropionibacterium acidipropionici]|uniref:hypothetical protein n=1 Tax=Acidipropionibacterium acidipropionici TaxID=1748 RepID=UPI001314A8F1|nr:hypothetical protein [Acidipropionibacterium acidipropionici]